MYPRFLTNEYFGEEAPWFGPLLKGYRTIVSSATTDVPDGEYDITAWIWDNAGHLLAEKVLYTCRGKELLTIDILDEFPEVEGKDGVIGILLHSKACVSPKFIEAWATRFVPPSGRMTSTVITTNPANLNFPSRTGRTYSYRMCSQELSLSDQWKPMSWHANVSADASYGSSISVGLDVYNENGDKLPGPRMTIPPFGALLVDLEEIFGNQLLQHLAKTQGRGSYMLYSNDGGAIGYHYLQNRFNLELAIDHTRPILRYLDMGYGASSALTDISPTRFVKESLRYVKFRANF